ncbi:MAG TPA: DUF2516 family protein [Pseudonocardiaceae bacterium]|nr:DUF2516 family protein [Pseudonocardiaceae bacterium]
MLDYTRLDDTVLRILYWAAVPVGLFAFFHAAFQRSDAYTAADKLTKPAWLGITGGACTVLLLDALSTINAVDLGSSLLFFFYLIGLVAVLVYIVDVKPAVTEVQRGPRW